MKKATALMFVLLAVTLMPGILFAGSNNHYVNGVEGIKGATVPPPGVYYRMYNVFYDADDLMDKDGNELNVDFDVTVFAVANRFIWVTDKKVLGADFFMDAILPLVNTDISINALGLDDREFGLGDIYLEPMGLAWHGTRYDAAVSLAVYLPTGSYDKNEAASPGKGYWTTMATLGGTLYLDSAKTWSASLLGRYEIHSDREDDDFTPGDDFHFEWGVGKSFAKVWEAGLAGYCQWQVTDDSGDDALARDDHDRVYAAGPEVSVFVPRFKMFLSLRSLWEFDAKDRSEGSTTALTLTKIF